MIQNKEVILISAIGTNNEIGINNDLPWKLQDDLLFFKKTTLNSIILMGKNTYDSIGRPLPNRLNIVLTTDISYKNKESKNLKVFSSIEESLEFIKTIENFEKVFIIGGSVIYNQFLTNNDYLKFLDYLYITKVKTLDHFKNEENLTYFPKIDNNYWKGIKQFSKIKNETNEFDFTVFYYQKL